MSAIPKGWKLVPHVPTKEMLEAAYEQRDRMGFMNDFWQAMYCAAAAPCADDTQVVVAGLNALLHDAQDEIARLTSTQGADARPVAIYQIRASRFVSDWTDVSPTDALFHSSPDEERRIVYATRDAAPSDAPLFSTRQDAARYRSFCQSAVIVDGSTEGMHSITFAEGHANSEVAAAVRIVADRLIAAIAPRGKT